MELHTLRPAEGAVKNKKRVGRGTASGKGGTAGKGTKGAQSRAGYKTKIGFEGGQMPLQRRIPKRGFKSLNRTTFKIFNLGQISELAEKYNLKEFSFETLYTNKLVGRDDLIKVLAKGELTSKIDIKVNAASAKAKELVEKAGSKLELI